MMEDVAPLVVEQGGPKEMMTDDSSRQDVHIEIVVPGNCPRPLLQVRSDWSAFLASGNVLWNDDNIDYFSVPADLRPTMQRLNIVIDHTKGDEDGTIVVDLSKALLHVHCFVLNDEEAVLEELEPMNDGDDFIPACENLTLPHKTLDGLWESLIFDDSIKSSLLQYAQSALLFSDCKVSTHIVQWNRLLLLEGPPGTGKTSLCRALSHTLAMRLSHRYPRVQLLELQSHSLFSKWFSTSGKLISRLFDMIRDMVQDDPSTLVCVLLDEVESLAATRSDLGGDPADSMRAVNALLVSLDKLQAFSNVLLLATTNMTQKVDAAFCDRADLQLYIGNPNHKARIGILQSCLEELQRVGLVAATKGDTVDWTQVADATKDMSGRSLRRLPLQAHALHLSAAPTPIPVARFVQAMTLTAKKKKGNKSMSD